MKQKRFFSYEKNREEVHELFGGKDYYTSRSGDSGSGWINEPNDHIQFGIYRTDARDQQYKKVVHVLENGKEIFGYMPIISHGGMDREEPIVLTDGTMVVFLPHDPELVIKTLVNWGCWKNNLYEDRGYNIPKVSVIEDTLYDLNGKKKEIKWALINFGFYGLRATRFIDLRQYRHQIPDGNDNILMKKLSIFKVPEKEVWLHSNRDGVFDEKYENDPRKTKGIFSGWESLGNGIFFKRKNSQIECFIETKRSEYANGKWWIENELSEWIDFEQNFSVIEFFSKTEEKISEILHEGLRKKAQQDYLYARKRAGLDLLRIMKEHPETYICIQDSLDTGNCLPGTESFMNEMNIKVNETGIKIQSLLENVNISKMIKNFNFQKVIYMKLNINEMMVDESEEMKEKLD